MVKKTILQIKLKRKLTYFKVRFYHKIICGRIFIKKRTDLNNFKVCFIRAFPITKQDDFSR